MVALSVGGNSWRGGAAVFAGLCIFLLSCVSAPSTPVAMTPAVAEVVDVQVVSEGGTTQVNVVGPVDPLYTAFQQEEPPRVVVDLAVGTAASVPEATAVYDGVVEEVAVTPFSLGSGEARTRIELSVQEAVDYEVVATADGLEIRVAPEGAGFASATPMETGTGESGAGFHATTEATTELASVDAEPAGTARNLLDIAAADDGNGTRIHLLADGAVEGAQHFSLTDPPRFVVDLPGMVSQTGGNAIQVGTAHADRVRIGQHADKVRIVIDAPKGTDHLAEPSVEQTFDGLVVTFANTPGGEVAEATPETATTTETSELTFEETPDGYVYEEPVDSTSDSVNEAVEEVVAELTEPVVETTVFEETEAVVDEMAPVDPVVTEAAFVEDTITDAADGTTIYGVQFDAQPERERVVVLSDNEVEWTVTEPDSETLMVRLVGATIDPEAAVRIAPDPAGSVALVTAFQQPEMSVPEVRIVVNRASGLVPEVTQRGTMLFVDFPRTGQTAAAVPVFERPAMPPMPETPASTGSAKAVAQATAQAAPETPPAAIGALESVDILEEGGLIDGKSYTGRRISLDFKDVEISDVLRLIAEVSDLNIIAGDEVQGQVTIRLVDVPWDQALDVILLTKGLGFIRVGNVLRIAPSDLLKAEEEARLQERRAKEKLEDLIVKLQPVNYADAGEISKMVTRLLSARGTVDVDQRTNTLILKDIASVVDEATALIKAIDTQTPQVLIEAKIVEANLDFSKEIGSAWSFGTQAFEDPFDPSSSPRDDISIGSSTFNSQPSPIFGSGVQGNHVAVANPITSLANGVLNLGAFILDDKFNVDVQLEAAESSGEGKVISSPRVVTLDNRKAKIEQGVSIPFQTFENGDAKLEFIDAVLKLEVTPHITADRSIIMQIEVQRNAPDDSVQTPTGSPAIAKNQAETETLVKDGQTLVIGGIYVVRKSERASGVPYFNKIPIIGAAFRNTEARDIRQELLVFVTPRIVVNPEEAS